MHKKFQYYKNQNALARIDPAAFDLDLEATQIALCIPQNGHHITAIFLDPDPDCQGEDICIWSQEINCGGSVITDVIEVHHWLLMVTENKELHIFDSTLSPF